MTTPSLKSKNFSAIILAAGLSSRMGRPKILLPYNKELTFIEQIINVYCDFGIEHIYIVVNKTTSESIEKKTLKLQNAKLIINPHPEWQKFYSLQLAAKAMSSIQDAFIQNIDNPFVTQNILSILVENCNAADYIVPTFEGKGGHPFLASKQIIKEVLKTINPQTHFKKFMRQFPSIRISVNDERVAVNINNQMEYEEWFKS
jgi:molybdenum cofactor cytidylyltransferase